MMGLSDGAAPRIIRIAFSSEGSSTFTTWNCRVSAGSLLMCFFSVLCPRRRGDRPQRAPASAGLSRWGPRPPVLGSPPRSDERVRLVDEQDDWLWRGLHLLEYAIPEPILEPSRDARTGLKQSKVEGIERDVAQGLRHVTGRNTECESFDDSGLSHPSFAREDRVILTDVSSGCEGFIGFSSSTFNGWIQFPSSGTLCEIHGKVASKRLSSTHRCGRGRLDATRSLRDAHHLVLGRPAHDPGKAVHDVVRNDLRNSREIAVSTLRRFGVLTAPTTTCPSRTRCCSNFSVPYSHPRSTTSST